jgi:hypothetical protein
MAMARDLSGGRNNVIAVIGDGAMSAGMAYEAMNNAGALGARLIVILNDNDMSIAPPVGAMSAYLASVQERARRSELAAAATVARAARKARFSEPGGLLGKLYGFYFRNVLPRIGTLISGVRGPYEYLPASVQKFPAPQEMLARMEAVGFKNVSWTPYTFGIAGLYRGKSSRSSPDWQ